MFLSAVLCYNWTDDKVGSGISIVFIILEKGLPITIFTVSTNFEDCS